MAPRMAKPSHIKTTDAQKKLLVVWLGVAAVPFLIMAIQTLLGRFDDRTQEAWGWLLPSIIPTLTLVIGTVVANAIRPPATDKDVDAFYWRLALGISVFYLILVTVVLLVTSMSASVKETITSMMQSNLFLGPVQGLAAASLGVFFVSGTPPKHEASAVAAVVGEPSAAKPPADEQIVAVPAKRPVAQDGGHEGTG